MSVLPVCRFPDAALKTPSRTVGPMTPEVRLLIRDLLETMRHHPRCVGLAAPQVGANVRVAVVDVTGHPKAARGSGLLVLVDPEIVSYEGRLVQREGCLSVPDLTGNVARAVRLQVKARDAEGRVWTKRVEDFEAIAVQHEIDHLDGKLFLDRVVSLQTDVFRRKKYA